MRMLMGTNQVVAKYPLLNIYRALIHPVIEYGIEVYLFCSVYSSLDKIHYEPLRLCTRGMRSTASICLLHSCREMPLYVTHNATVYFKI